MVPEDLSQFFAASAGAAATLIGLLSVANSIINDQRDEREVSLQRSILAETAYGALANIFFVTLCALVPFINIGLIAVLMAIIGLSTLRYAVGRGLRKLYQLNKNRARLSAVLFASSAVVYLAELVIGLLVLFEPDHPAVDGVVYIILALYGVGMARAWELLGVRATLRDS